MICLHHSLGGDRFQSPQNDVSLVELAPLVIYKVVGREHEWHDWHLAHDRSLEGTSLERQETEA